MLKKFINHSILIFLVACIFALLSFFLQVSPATTSDYVTHAFLLDSSQVATLSALYFVSYALLQIPNGIFMDKFGVRKILPISILITLIGCIIYWLSPNAAFLGISRFIVGGGSSVAYIGSIFIAAKLFKPRNLPICIAFVEISSTIGAILAQNTYRSILSEWGWNFANIIVILIASSIYLLSLVLLKQLPVHSPSKVSDFSFHRVLKDLNTIFKKRALLGIFSYSFFSWALIMTFAGYWSKGYFQYMHHFEESKALEFSEVYWGSFLISSLFIGMLSRSKQVIKKWILGLSILGFLAYAFMSIPVLFNEFGLFVFLICSGISVAGVSLGFSLISYIVNEQIVGTVVSINNMFVVLGGFCGQIVFGFMIKLSINYDDKIAANNINMQYYTGLLLLTLCSLLALLSFVFSLRSMKTHDI